MKSFFNKHKEIIVYIFFGVLSTVISWGSYIVYKQMLNLSVSASNILSWCTAVIFAFVTNKFWVFNSKSLEPKVVGKEFVTFISSRIITGVIEIVSVPFLTKIGLDKPFFSLFTKLNLSGIKILFTDGIYSKIIISVVIVILNYVFSKLIVFKTNPNKEQ